MRVINRFATRRPLWFAVASIVVWLVLLVVFMGLASGLLRRPYGDGDSVTMARLACAVCVVALVWRLGWLRSSGIGQLGGWRIWLLTLGGLIYFAGASLHSFYGRVGFDPGSLLRLPAAQMAVLAVFVAALGEELLFRGLVLHGLVRVWASSRSGVVASVVLVALLFAALHTTQVLTNDLSRSAAALLALQTLIVSIWWGALVVSGGSLWPAVLLHFMGNALIALQGFGTPAVEASPLAYQRLVWFSVPLGLVGLGLLARFRPRLTTSPTPAAS